MEIVISFPLDTYSEAGFGTIGQSLFFLILRRTSKLFSMVVLPIDVSTNKAQGFLFIHILTHTYLWPFGFLGVFLLLFLFSVVVVV